MDFKISANFFNHLNLGWAIFTCGCPTWWWVLIGACRWHARCSFYQGIKHCWYACPDWPPWWLGLGWLGWLGGFGLVGPTPQWDAISVWSENFLTFSGRKLLTTFSTCRCGKWSRRCCLKWYRMINLSFYIVSFMVSYCFHIDLIPLSVLSSSSIDKLIFDYHSKQYDPFLDFCRSFLSTAWLQSPQIWEAVTLSK